MGLYEDGMPGELFLTMAKEGTWPRDHHLSVTTMALPQGRETPLTDVTVSKV